MNNHQQFVQLLEQLTISDNSARSNAEKQYDTMKGDMSILPHLPISMLTTLADDSVPNHIRQLAAVLLRRLLVEDDPSVYISMDTILYVYYMYHKYNVLYCI